MIDALANLDVAVVGAGISGLTAAYHLKKAGRRVIVLESEHAPGGCIGSFASGPYIADRGPQTFVAAGPLADLARDLGIDGALTKSSANATRRYIYRHSRLIAVPSSPAGFIATPLLSAGAKWRLLAEPFVHARLGGGDESIADFARRRGGSEIVGAVVGPLVSGIFAGDPAKLSIRSAAPGLSDLEQDGSVLFGMLRRLRAARGQRATAGFIQGNQTLVYALARALEGSLRTGVVVRRVTQKGANFALECNGLPEGVVEARKVLLALPARGAADLLALMEPDAAGALREIETPPIAQLALAYPRAAIGTPLDGFGFLTCRDEGVRLLGAVWNSVLFPDRGPSDQVLMTAFYGGALDPEVASCSDQELAQIAHAEIARIMRIADGIKPNVIAGFRWDAGIPQYTLGHAGRIARVLRSLARLPGVHVIGNFLRGASVADCILVGKETAQAL